MTIRIGFLCTGIALTLALSFSAATAADDSTEGYARAQNLFHTRNFREALTALDPYIAIHPLDAHALVLRGDAKANLGENDSALSDYNTAIKLAPQYEYAYVTRCETRLQLDDLAGALLDCDTAIRLDAVDAHAYEARADVLFARSAYASALLDYDKAVELGRSDAYVFAARCDSERLVGKLDAAKVDCERALGLDPKGRRVLWSRGRLALVEARYSDGIADLSAYIAQRPAESDFAYYFRGLAHNRMKNYGSALEDLNTYVRRRPADPDGYKERALANNGTGARTAALADLDVARKGYLTSGDTREAARVGAMITAIGAGRIPQP